MSDYCVWRAIELEREDLERRLVRAAQRGEFERGLGAGFSAPGRFRLPAVSLFRRVAPGVRPALVRLGIASS